MCLIDKGWTEFYITGCLLRYMRGAEQGRPGQEAHQQFKAGLPGNGNGERRASGVGYSRDIQPAKAVPPEQAWYEQDVPHDQLVATLRHFRDKEIVREETSIQRFNTAEWLADELDTQAERSANSDVPSEEITFFNDLKIAWFAFAHPQFGKSLSGIARKEIGEYIQATGSTSVTLRPKAVKLFDAMAEVAELPRKRGETTVDIASFVKRVKI
jgi:hypothetical protein